MAQARLRNPRPQHVQSRKHAGDIGHQIDERSIVRSRSHRIGGLRTSREACPLMNRRNWLGHEQCIDRAMELAPGMPAPLNRVLGTFYSFVREPTAALEQLQAAARVDPLSMYTSALFQIKLLIAGRLRKRTRNTAAASTCPAIPRWRSTWHCTGYGRAARPSIPSSVFHSAHNYAAISIVHRRVRLRFLRTCTSSATIPPRDRKASRSRGRLGLSDPATSARARVLARSIRRQRCSVRVCVARLRRDGFFNVGWLWFPVLKPVRTHARFPELLARVGLTDYWRAKGRTPAIA